MSTTPPSPGISSAERQETQFVMGSPPQLSRQRANVNRNSLRSASSVPCNLNIVSKAQFLVNNNNNNNYPNSIALFHRHHGQNNVTSDSPMSSPTSPPVSPGNPSVRSNARLRLTLRNSAEPVDEELQEAPPAYDDFVNNYGYDELPPPGFNSSSSSPSVTTTHRGFAFGGGGGRSSGRPGVGVSGGVGIGATAAHGVYIGAGSAQPSSSSRPMYFPRRSTSLMFTGRQGSIDRDPTVTLTHTHSNSAIRSGWDNFSVSTDNVNEGICSGDSNFRLPSSHSHNRIGSPSVRVSHQSHQSNHHHHQQLPYARKSHTSAPIFSHILTSRPLSSATNQIVRSSISPLPIRSRPALYSGGLSLSHTNLHAINDSSRDDQARPTFITRSQSVANDFASACHGSPSPPSVPRKLSRGMSLSQSNLNSLEGGALYPNQAGWADSRQEVGNYRDYYGPPHSHSSIVVTSSTGSNVGRALTSPLVESQIPRLFPGRVSQLPYTRYNHVSAPIPYQQRANQRIAPLTTVMNDFNQTPPRQIQAQAQIQTQPQTQSQPQAQPTSTRNDPVYSSSVEFIASCGEGPPNNDLPEYSSAPPSPVKMENNANGSNSPIVANRHNFMPYSSTANPDNIYDNVSGECCHSNCGYNSHAFVANSPTSTFSGSPVLGTTRNRAVLSRWHSVDSINSVAYGNTASAASGINNSGLNSNISDVNIASGLTSNHSNYSNNGNGNRYFHNTNVKTVNTTGSVNSTDSANIASCTDANQNPKNTYESNESSPIPNPNLNTPSINSNASAVGSANPNGAQIHFRQGRRVSLPHVCVSVQRMNLMRQSSDDSEAVRGQIVISLTSRDRNSHSRSSSSAQPMQEVTSPSSSLPHDPNELPDG